MINRREIDVDLFRILENIEGNGKKWLPWMSDISGEDEADLSTPRWWGRDFSTRRWKERGAVCLRSNRATPPEP